MSHDLDPLLRKKLMEYNRPPEVPRERMWEAIQERRREERSAQTPRSSRRVRAARLRRLAWPAVAVALLVLGIGLGRMSRTPNPVSRGASSEGTAPPPSQEMDLYSLAAERYLGRAEILLTRYKLSADDGESLDGFRMRAGQLLLETRLLLDSPAGEDRDTARLLRELELVLARMARVGADVNGDRRILDESLESGTLMMRLKTRKPAAMTPNGA